MGIAEALLKERPMAATRTFEEVFRLLKKLGELEALKRFMADARRWTLELQDGTKIKGQDFRIHSPLGSVESAVVVDSSGKPVYDRPAYREAPNVNIIAYGYNKDGKVRMAIICQPRPHADDPEQPGNGHPPVVFGQIPMGFLERKVLGEDSTPQQERGEDGAKRELEEETGTKVVKRLWRPAYPHMFPNPTFCATWSEVFFAEVDLERIEQLKEDRSEPIFSAEYISVPELLRRIRDGKDAKGAVYRMGISLADLMLFFATCPECFTSEE